MRPAAPRLLVPLLLALLGRSGADSGEDMETVPVPTDVVIKSLDFKTWLHWNYVSMPLTPYFTVEIKPYDIGIYQPVKTCRNIKKHKCDLSKEIKELSHSHWVRVKALIGSEESEYVETKEFILRRDGKIRPPNVTLSIEDDGRIKVDVYHPSKLTSIAKNVCKDLMYYVYFQRNKENPIQEIQTEECDKDKCSINIPNSSFSSTYCVSARGFSTCVSKRAFSQSNESCIHVPFNQPLDINVLIGVAVVFGIGLILAIYCVYKLLKKRKIELPKSLVSVVRSLNSRNIFETKPEAKYLSVITSSPTSTNEEVNFKEEEVDSIKEIGTLNSEDCSKETDAVNSQEISYETKEISSQESTAEISHDNERSPRVKEKCFHSNGGQTEVCGILSKPEPSNTKMQQSIVPRSCNTFSGYDKPHVPLHLLIDVGEEESVIAYKHTDELQG
uniref:Interferon gamma receptor 1 n=1 Tax=Pelusios castaneus TaxID=367368 RepID=A0A8C8SY19_9SAUR